MCGIAGIISENRSAISGDILERMSTCISHRGPDASSTWISEDGNAGFAHRRLAILDLSNAGNQPQHLHERYSIIHNGEIYNYLELRSELQSKGYSFRTGTDTEVILAAYSLYGTDCVQHFDGMFAFAIWDSKSKKLFLARDRLGEKPLFYSYDQKKSELTFASGLRAIHAAGISKNVNHSLLLQFLAVGHSSLVTQPAATFYTDIFQVRAGHFMVYDVNNNMLTEENYWNCPKQTTGIGTAEASSELLRILKKSVSLRMRSDVQLGTSLSGGLDSNSIASLIQQLAPGTYKSFSAVFPGYHKDESALIKLGADRWSIQSFTTTPSASDLGNELDKFIYAHEIPVATPTAFAQYKVFQLARQHGVKVMLDGQGADEILAGYPKYHHWFLQELISRGNWKEFRLQWQELQKTNPELNFGPANFLASWFPFQAAHALERKERRAILHTSQLSESYVNEYYHYDDTYKMPIHELNDILYFNTFQSGLEELLRLADRNSMAHGCEVRLPFLSQEFVQFCFSLPATLKINQGFGKYILRKAMSGNIPDEICWNRKKIGFDVPIDEWLNDKQLALQLEQSYATLEKDGILNRPRNRNKKPQANAAAEWRILIAGKWMAG